MKFRNDFVTNSSSSSFLVAYKKTPDIDKETLARYPFIKMYPQMINFILDCGNERYSETETAQIIDSKEKLDNYIIGTYGESDDSIEDMLDEWYSKEEYDKQTKLIDDGYVLFRKRIDYSDDVLRDMLRLLAKNNTDFIILEDE